MFPISNHTEFCAQFYWARRTTSYDLLHWQEVNWIKSYLLCVERTKSMTKKTRTFLPGPSTWSLKPCYIWTVERLKWFFCVCLWVGLCVLVCVCDNGKNCRVVRCWCNSVKVTPLILLIFLLCRYIDVTQLMSLCLYFSIDVALLMSLCWWKDMWLSTFAF